MKTTRKVKKTTLRSVPALFVERRKKKLDHYVGKKAGSERANTCKISPTSEKGR